MRMRDRGRGYPPDDYVDGSMFPGLHVLIESICCRVFQHTGIVLSE